MRMNQRLKRGRDIHEPYEYLRKTIRNINARRLRRERGSPVQVVDGKALMAAEELPGNLVSNEPEQKLSTRQAVVRFMRWLRPTYRKIFFLDRVLGMTTEEIAIDLDMSPHTIRLYKTRLGKWCREAWKDLQHD